MWSSVVAAPDFVTATSRLLRVLSADFDRLVLGHRLFHQVQVLPHCGRRWLVLALRTPPSSIMPVRLTENGEILEILSSVDRGRHRPRESTERRATTW